MMPRLALAAALLVASAGTARAHKPSDAHLRLAVDGARLDGRLDVAVRDLDAALAVDDDGDGDVTWGELTAAAPRITAYLAGRLALAADGAPCELALPAASLVELSDGAYWAQPVSARCAAAPDGAVTVRYGLLFDVDAQHRGLVHVAGATAIVRDRAPVELAVASGGSSNASFGASFGAFVEEGVWHIWIGLDHVLFLLCLLLPAVFPRTGGRAGPAGSLRGVAAEVLEIVTAFTLAHSITLVLSAAGLVQLPSRLVETAIALSVVAAALNNLVRAIDARWAVAFALGLLHGFGFSSVLADLGLPPDQRIASLLGFNAGVELGQLAIVAALLPALYGIRRTLAYRALLYAGSGAAAVLATVWTFERWLA